MTDERRTGKTRRLEDEDVYHLAIAVARLEEKNAAASKAIEVAKEEIDRRLLEMNQLRHQISEERGHYVLRLEFDTKHDTLNRAVSNLQRFQWGMIGGLAVFQVLIGLVLHYIK